MLLFVFVAWANYNFEYFQVDFYVRRADDAAFAAASALVGAAAVVAAALGMKPVAAVLAVVAVAAAVDDHVGGDYLYLHCAI